MAFSLSLVAVFCMAQDAGEEDTRAGRLTKQRQERLATVQPVRPSKVAEVMSTIETKGFDSYISMQIGHWRFGGGKVSPLSSFAPGVSYDRRNLGGSPISLTLAGAYSIRSYQIYVFRIGKYGEPAPRELLGSGFFGQPFYFSQRTQDKLSSFLYTEVAYRNFPHEEFFGIGADSNRDHRSEYRYEGLTADVVGGYQFARWLAIEARGGVMTTNVGPGNREHRPDVQDLFDPAQTPGLATQPEYLRLESAVYASYDTDPGKPAGSAGLRYARFQDRDGGKYSFQRLSMDLRGSLPLGSRQRVVAARLFASRDKPDGGAQVPFYMMQTLGGADTLRGYRNYRFRDTRVLYMSGEYRWEANASVELVGFYDAGKVFPEGTNFAFRHFRHTVGGGIRAKNVRRVSIRMEVGVSPEGALFFFSFGPAF